MLIEQLYNIIEPKLDALSDVNKIIMDKDIIVVSFRKEDKTLKIKKEPCHVDLFAISYKDSRNISLEEAELLKVGAKFKETFGAKYEECGVLNPTVFDEMVALNEKYDNCYSKNDKDSFETMFTDNSNRFCIMGKPEDNKARIYAKYIKTDNGYIENTTRVKTVDLRTDKNIDDFINWISNIEVNFF